MNENNESSELEALRAENARLLDEINTGYLEIQKLRQDVFELVDAVKQLHYINAGACAELITVKYQFGRHSEKDDFLSKLDGYTEMIILKNVERASELYNDIVDEYGAVCRERDIASQKKQKLETKLLLEKYK